MKDKEYIERGALLNALKEERKNGNFVFTSKWIKEIMDNLPTADVVEVVRCKDCKYTDVHICPITGKETLFCEFGRRGIKPEAVNPTHFCGYGERKDK